jgi:hypothetical protein
MALATNTRYQLAARLVADLQLTNGMTVTQSQTLGNGGNPGCPVAGDPLLTVFNSAGTKIALISVDQLTFNGFNVVAELSSSAAVGLPEHTIYLLENSANTQLDTSLLAATVKRMSTATIKFGFTAVGNLTEANLSDANIAYQLPNDARLGASGQ